MPSLLSNLGLPQCASSSRMPMPANMAEVQSEIMHGHVEAVRARLSEEGLSREAWNALQAHVPGSVAKEVLQRVLADAALKHAVRTNDIDTAREALLRGADPESIAVHAGTDGDMPALLTYARRKNKLYPTGPHGPETALDRTLRNGLDQHARHTAKALLQQAVGNKNVREAWRDAVKNKQLDIQRAILLLGNVERDRAFRVLQEDAVTDSGVAAVMKEIPYFSPKRKLPNNFNCQTTFPGTDEPIACRQLVEHRQAKLEQSEQRKFDDTQYASVENIADKVSYATNAQYAHLRAHAVETHLFHNHDFGKLLGRQFGDMQRKKETSRLLLLESDLHAMSVELKVKEKDGKPHYVAALFDPNATTSHIRFASDDVRILEGLTLKGLIASESLYKLYYPNSDEISILFARPSAPVEPAEENRRAGAVPNRMLTSCIEGEQLSSTALYYLLDNGFSGDIRRLKNEIAKRPEEERLRLLEAKSADGTPGLFMALQNGHADAVEAFGKVLKDLQVPWETCAKLLRAERNDGRLGFHLALQTGQADAIEAFGKVLEDLQVPPEKRVELLTAKSPGGPHGLYCAMETGQDKAIEAFGKVLADLQMPHETWAELLEEKRADGTPGLQIALVKGHAKAIEAFCKVVEDLQVPPEKRVELLTAKRADGPHGLYWALQDGHADTITAFGKVLADLQMPHETWAELLEEKTADGTPGLYCALGRGYAKAITAFGKVLADLKVPHETCAKLLAAERADKLPGLYWSLEKGYADTITAFGKVLADLKIPHETCAKLLAAKRADKLPGLFMALQNGHANVIEAFGEALVVLQVPRETCARLLAAKRADELPGLFMALQNGHAAAIAAFGKVMADLQLSPEKCAEMLAAKKADGVSGLAIALQKKHLEAMEQYIKIVTQIAPDLGHEQRTALLQEIRKSHAKHIAGKWWDNFKHYDKLKKANPDFYRRFKEMKDALKEQTG